MLVMATRQTNTGMEAAFFLFPLSQAPVTSANALSTMVPTLHAVRPDPIQPSALGTTIVSSASHAPVPGQAPSLSPNIVALLKPFRPLFRPASRQPRHKPSQGGSIAIPASITSLGSLTSSLLAAGTSFPSGQAASVTPQDRPAPIVVPSFVSTFAYTCARFVIGAFLEQRFAHCSDFTQCRPSSQFYYWRCSGSTLCCWPKILADSSNIGVSDCLPEPQLLLDGCLVLTTIPKKNSVGVLMT